MNACAIMMIVEGCRRSPEVDVGRDNVIVTETGISTRRDGSNMVPTSCNCAHLDDGGANGRSKRCDRENRIEQLHSCCRALFELVVMEDLEGNGYVDISGNGVLQILWIL